MGDHVSQTRFLRPDFLELSENAGPQKHPKTIRSGPRFINNHCNVGYKYDIFGHPHDVNSSQ